jgi:hypothetical protein
VRNARLDRVLARREPHLRRLRPLVGAVDAGDVGDRAGAGLGVEPLGVALLGDLEGVSTSTSTTSPSSNISRTSWRSLRNGLMKAVRTIRPASVMSLATSPMRRMFSTHAREPL